MEDKSLEFSPSISKNDPEILIKDDPKGVELGVKSTNHVLGTNLTNLGGLFELLVLKLDNIPDSLKPILADGMEAYKKLQITSEAISEFDPKFMVTREDGGRITIDFEASAQKKREAKET